jgi:hypothetical protein
VADAPALPPPAGQTTKAVAARMLCRHHPALPALLAHLPPAPPCSMRCRLPGWRQLPAALPPRLPLLPASPRSYVSPCALFPCSPARPSTSPRRTRRSGTTTARSASVSWVAVGLWCHVAVWDVQEAAAAAAVSAAQVPAQLSAPEPAVVAVGAPARGKPATQMCRRMPCVAGACSMQGPSDQLTVQLITCN